ENTPLNYLSNRIKLISVANSSKKQVPLEISDFNNPFFNAVFEKKNSRLNTPQAKKIYKPSSFNYSILQFPDGDPFLYYNTLGKGKVFVFTTSLNKKYTDLANHALCVPIFYTMAIQTNASSTPLFTRTDGIHTVKTVQSAHTESIIHLIQEANDIIPSQYPSGKNNILELPDDISSGIYTVKAINNQLGKLAVNNPKAESNTSFYSTEELKNILSAFKNISIWNESSFKQLILDRKLSSASIPLWKYCVVLSLLFLVIEILLIRFLR
ncbi:MAG: hypothetical protein AB8B61_05655, partial [Cyclobacteriaceae bacterium]